MQFTTILAVFAATLASASPVAQPESLVSTTMGGSPNTKGGSQQLIDLWTDADFLAFKFTGSANVGDCKNLPKDFQNDVSSGKAKPGFRCTIWVDRDCQGTGFSFNANPGISSLPNWINDKASSWKCVAA